MKRWEVVLLFVLGLLLIVASRADASYRLIELRELSIDYKNYAWLNPNARHPLLYPEHPKEGVDLNLKTDLFDWFFWDNSIKSLTTGSQYRTVGLETRFGVYVSDYLNVGYYHQSQHLLERSHHSIPKFPVEDAVEFKLYLYRDRPARDSMF